MIHFVYETINLVNGKKYIGKHSAESLEDSYLGSGSLLKKAIKKHGRQNFRRTILATFNCSEDALDYERLVVDSNVVKSESFYNLKVGGIPNNTFHTSQLKGSSKQTNLSIQKQVESRKTRHIEKMNALMREISNELHVSNSELIEKFKISESTLCRMKKRIKNGLSWDDSLTNLPHGLKGSTKDVAQWRLESSRKTGEKLKSAFSGDKSPLVKVTSIYHTVIQSMLSEGKTRKEIQETLKHVASKVTLNRHITKISNKYNIPINERRS